MWLSFGLLLFLSTRSTTAVDNNNYFLYPPQSYPDQHFGPTDPIWLVGTTVTLRWVTNLDSYNITLWQQNPHEGRAGPAKWAPVYVKNSDDPEIGGEGFQWSVQTYGLDFKSPIPVGSPVFFLAGGDILNTPGAPGFVSYYINITDNAQDPSLQAQGLGSGNPTTTSLSSQTSSTQVSTVTTTPSLSSASFIGSESSSPSGDGSSGSQSSTAPASSITTSIIQISTTDQALPTTDSLNGTPSPANSASSTSTDHSNKISTGTIVAIGLGCGLGVPVISLLAWLAFRREMRIRKDEKAASAAAPPSYDAFKLNPRDPSQGQPTIAEAEAKSARLPRYELGGGVRTELPANESTVGKVR